MALTNNSEKIIDSFFIVIDGRIVEVGRELLKLTGYCSMDFIGKSMEEACKIMRLNTSNILQKPEVEEGCFIFTKALEVKEVKVLCQEIGNINQIIYYFREEVGVDTESDFPFNDDIFLNNSLGIAVYSVPDFILLKANPKYFNYLDNPFKDKRISLGMRKEEIIKGFNQSELELAYKSGSVFLGNELKYDDSKNGENYWDISIVPVYKDGKIRFIFETANDATERVFKRKCMEEKNKCSNDVTEYLKKEKLIIAKNREFQEIIDNISDGIILFDKDRNYTFVNKEGSKFFYEGYKVRKLGDSFGHTKYYNSEGALMNIEDMPWERILSGEKISQFKLTAKRPDGIFNFSINGSPISDDNGNIISAVLKITDITEYILQDKIIERQRDYIYKIFNILELPIITIGYPHMEIKETNKKALSFFKGLLKEKMPEFDLIKGEVAEKIIPDFINYQDSFRKMIETKNIVHLRDYKINTGENDLYLNIIFEPILDLNEEIIEVLLIYMDVTFEIKKRKDIENAMKMREEFFNFIAHEFRTPLTTISSTIQLMESVYKKDMTSKIMDLTKVIKRSTFQQLRLVNNLLDITRAEAGYLKLHHSNCDIIEMTKAITNSVMEYANNKGVNIKFSSKLDKKIISIDDEKYERILLNIISNAIKFTSSGKTIKVKVFQNGDNVNITIKDKGVGIPKEKQDIIFERFGQTDSKLTREGEGTGIGLYLVKLLVKSLGGNIYLQSEENIGSIFTVELPDILTEGEVKLPELNDNRLVQSLQIEFSNIYFD